MSKVKLGELGNFKNGLNFSAEKVSSGCKIIGIPDFQDNFIAPKTGLGEISKDIVSDDYLLNDNDILFVRSNGNKALVGRTMLVYGLESPTTFSGFCIRFRPNQNKVDPLYMLYLFKSPLFRNYFSKTQQTSINNLNQDVLSRIEFDLPDIERQRKIAKTIHYLTEKIENNSRINDNLQQMAKTIYDYWFTQFDFPDADGKPYCSSGGKMVWNDVLKRDIPAGWQVKKISDICDIVLGGTPSTDVPEYWNGNINWLNSGEVSQFPVVKSEAKISNLGLNNSPAKLMPIGTTIVSITGNIRASILSIEACANQSVVGILESPEIKKEYIYQNILRLLDRFTTISTGNCQQHINKGTIEDALIILPKQEILMAYYSAVFSVYGQMSEVSIENQKLTELRDWLLPMLMNGQATIAD